MTRAHILRIFFILCNLISVLSTAANNYHPNSNVKAAHKIPHRYQIGEKGTTFVQYFTGVAIFPGILGLIGIFSVLIFQFSLCIRWCCRRCCKRHFVSCCECGSCLRESDPSHNEKRTRVMIGAFVFLVVLVIIADTCVFRGSTSVVKSAHTLADALRNLGDIFTTISEVATNMGQAGVNMGSVLASNSCLNVPQNTANTITSATSSFDSAAASISSIIGTFPTLLDNAASSINSKFLTTFTRIVYVYFAIIFFVISCFGLAVFCKSRALLLLFVIKTELIVITLTIISCFEMFILVRIIVPGSTRTASCSSSQYYCLPSNLCLTCPLLLVCHCLYKRHKTYLSCYAPIY